MKACSIDVSGLGKRYDIYDRPAARLLDLLYRKPGRSRPFWALRDVSFSCRAGETLGIIGRNGSGKSTLLQILCGTTTATEGAVNIRGRVAALLELGAGFNPEFTGLENVRLNAAILGLSADEIEARLPDIMAFAEIGDFIHQPVKVYSSGMFLRLAFAVIAHVDADIMIVDEALAVGDVVFVQKCMRFLRRFREHGILIFVSHDPGMVTALCDHALWLNQGQVMRQGDATDVTSAYIEFTYAAEQGASTGTQPSVKPATQSVANKGAENSTKKNTSKSAEPLPVDFRHEQITSLVPNQIRIFSFTDEVPDGFGTGQVSIEHVRLQDEAGHALSVILGGESVVLSITWTAHTKINGPIVGFMLKDRRGQFLFGDNTFLTKSDLVVPAGKSACATFRFRMPYLPQGDYAIMVSVAEGTQDEHVQHEWIHEAVLLHSDTSHVAGGLIGLPMAAISLELS